MKKISRRSFLTAAAACGAAAALSACGGSSASSTAASSTAGSTAASAAAGPVTLQWSVWDKESTPYWQAMADGYMASHKDVTIEMVDLGSSDYMTVLATQLAGSADLDIVTIKDIPGYANLINLDYLKPLNEVLTRDTGDFNGTIEQLTTDDGNFYAVPFRSDFWVLYYNKDLFDAAGVEYPSNDLTMEDYDALARKMTSGSGDTKVYGCHYHTWRSAASLFSILDGKNTIIDGTYDFMKPTYDMVIAQQKDGICMDYGYHGYVNQRELQFVREEELWEYLGADLILVGRATDVLSLPKVQGVRMMELERGGVLRRQPETVEEVEAHKGWAKVLLTDGRTGYVRDVALEPVKYEMTAVFSQREGLAFNDALAETLNTTAEKLVPEAVARWYGGSEEAFRAAVCEQAKKYMGTEYRWGGKSGRGIDCSGLVSSAYMQCGVLIYRDAKIIEGWPMHEVAFEDKKPGDALFFPGHVALYLGEGRYIHSTGAAASGGVVINSLEPDDPLYREDLVKCLYAVGSVF